MTVQTMETTTTTQIPTHLSPSGEMEGDLHIFEQLTQLMLDQQIYLTPNATLDQVAVQMKTNRTYLSQAVNRCTGGNFRTFLNNFRVKEAVRLMSSSQSQNLCMEGIATSSGFNDRITFYRAFKKLMGVAPSEYVCC